MNILMVAAENDGIAECKVGGIGDVVRDIPLALSNNGCTVSVVTPSYGHLHETDGAEAVADISFPFSGAEQWAVLYRVRARTVSSERVTHFVIDHPAFKKQDEERGVFEIYSHDDARHPFATDATKFACFNAAVASAIKAKNFGPLDVLHLHDWHAAVLFVLRRFDKESEHLRTLRTVYTIHNLSLQGIRPFENDASSLESWFPRLEQTQELLDTLTDPRWPDCFNPMATGIRLSDAVHTVSPTYAEEILHPSRPSGFFGGEGLEEDLKQAKEQKRLHGILNGCEYPEPCPQKRSFHALLNLIRKDAVRWAARRNALTLADYAAFQTLEALSNARKKPTFIATGISRLTDQKMLILRSSASNGKTGLENILEHLGNDRLFILIGSGDRTIEAFFAEAAATHANFLFLNSYSNAAAEALYTCGDLFLMPSSFEPCGIGQMLAMRAGQPCLVHRTGGLRDTVTPGVNGFGFEGETLTDQVDAMIATLNTALDLHSHSSNDWKKVCDAAAQARFEWDQSAKQYIETLYR